MAQALYRKYRSKKLSEVIGQDHITKTLNNALKSGQISHAYLLTGPKGTGKTSVARILAHEINKLPYNDDSTHLDIIEIDAASNRRIDEIRDLREKVNLAPTSAKYKIYIIDEVHMLTREAFNALLKTLEEPPEHVIFILATTELHKLPETIISRTQRFGFKPIATSDMVPQLRKIADKEGIVVDDNALLAIAIHANGGFRDAISLLDQSRGSGKNIDLRAIDEMLGKASEEQIKHCMSAITDDNSHEALNIVSSLISDGYSPEIISGQLLACSREMILKDAGLSREIIDFMTDLLEITRSSNPRIALELAVMKAGNTLAGNTPVEKVIHNQDAEKKMKQQIASTESTSTKKTPEKPEKVAIKSIDDKLWSAVLEDIKGQHNTLYGILRMAEVSQSNESEISLAFQFPFHIKRASEAKHLAVINKTLKLIGGKDYAIRFIKRTIDSPKESENTASRDKKSAINKVRDVFGDAELLD